MHDIVLVFGGIIIGLIVGVVAVQPTSPKWG